MHSMVQWQTRNDAAFLAVVNEEMSLVFRNLSLLQFDYSLEDLGFSSFLYIWKAWTGY